MAINLKAARDFVYANGTLWERALFAYVFQGGSLDRLHQCLLNYKNADGGFGHALEHDIRCPESHPAALEFLLGMMATFDIPAGNLLDGTAAWVEAHRAPDGSVTNPTALLDYPHAPWWDLGGQSAPDSIVGLLRKLGHATPSLLDSTARWTAANLTTDTIHANEWLFMAYHAFDYYAGSGVPEETAAYQNIVACASKAEPQQYYEILRFIPSPTSHVTAALPAGLLDKMLDHLQGTQQADGSWHDEHGLPQWYPYVTIMVLNGLRHHGRDVSSL